jgi:hypothetical protein
MIELPDNYDPRFPMNAEVYLKYKMRLRAYKQEDKLFQYRFFAILFMIALIGLLLSITL